MRVPPAPPRSLLTGQKQRKIRLSFLTESFKGPGRTIFVRESNVEVRLFAHKVTIAITSPQ